MRILVTGASGLIGRAVSRQLAGRHDVLGTSRSGGPIGPGIEPAAWELADAAGIRALARAFRPDFVLHLAAESSAEVCERDPELAWQLNVEGTRHALAAAAEAGAHLAAASTDLVFDGRRGGYTEDDPPSPLPVYGRTKAPAEELVVAGGGCALRIAAVYGDGRGRRASFSEMILDGLEHGRRPRLFVDQFRSHLYVEDIAPVAEAVALGRIAGRLHVAGPERLSRLQFGLVVAEVFGLDPAGLEPIRLSEMGFAAARPADCSLATGRLSDLLGLRLRDARAGLADQKDFRGRR